MFFPVNENRIRLNTNQVLLFMLWQDTFTRAKNWVKELQRQASPNIVIALAGNKADIANKRAIDQQVSVISTMCVYKLV